MNTSDDSNREEEFSWKWLTGGWAKSIFVLVFLVIAFYVEEDWRGAVAWKQAQAEIAAAGESLDPNKFIPPPVPDAENFGLLPIFQFDPSTGQSIGMDNAFTYTSPYKILTSKDQSDEKDYLPYLGNWEKGEIPDLPTIQKRLIELCRSDLPATPIPPNAKPVELFDLLCPALADLRTANATHPVCRFDQDYTTQPPMFRSLGGITSPIKLAKVLAYEERLAFLSGQPQRALDDLKVSWKVDSGLRQEPLLIAGLVSVGAGAIQRQVITEGLAEHLWNDQQLAELDDDLGKIDYLTGNQFCVRGEVVVFEIPDVNYLKEHRFRIREAIFGFGYVAPSSSSLSDRMRNLLFSTVASLIPGGWFDQYKADAARFHLLGTVKMVDPLSQRVFPEKEEKALHLIEESRTSSYWHEYLIKALLPTFHSVRPFAYAQVQTDEARIACRLERYRLAHGAYPPSLDALAPNYGAELPHDLMNGETYHYRLNGDGTYLLYSVGWDQKDDGGNGTPPQYQAPSYAPDWVWPNHPDTMKTK